MHYVKKINQIDGYKLTLTFNDNKIKIVNLETYLDKGIFLVLRDLDYFSRVQLNKEAGPIVWPNEADFCPDVLYTIGKEVKIPKSPAYSKRQKH
jgi:hypothetical protein